MKRKALITGVLGQDGPYLAKLLLEKGYSVYGMMQKNPPPIFANTDHLDVTRSIEFVEGDMTNETQLTRLIQTIRPHEVYNLAAQSFVGVSWEHAKETTQVNALGVLYLLEAIRKFSPDTRFYQASTSEMFGNYRGVITEETPFHPRSPYAVSKVYAYWMTENFKESYNLFCVNGILFNHESPLRGLQFVTRKITDGVARIKLGFTQELLLGNLDSKRDWGFAGDYVEAIWRMLQQSNPEHYIVCTGETHSIRDFLDVAFRHVGIVDWQSYVKLDPRFKRPAELFENHGSAEKARQQLGWKPKVTFQELVALMVDADLQRLKSNNFL